MTRRTAVLVHRFLATSAVAILVAVIVDAGDRAKTIHKPAPVVAAVPVPAPKPVKRAPPPPPEPVYDLSTFDGWLQSVRADAKKAGVSEATLDRELDGLTEDPSAIALDQKQPDRTAVSPMTFAKYHAKQFSRSRINNGRRLASDLSATLSSVEKQYGVPHEILLAIWGIETSYGAVTGNFDLVRSLATLAYEGRRREFFTAELIAALKLIDDGKADRATLVGSWAGATGQSQFMPSSYFAHAADGDGDGRADIWGSRADVLASIASYFVGKGWQTGEPWAVSVSVPAGFDRERIRELTPVTECAGLGWRHSRWLSVAEWKAMGVAGNGAALPADDKLATLIEPDGPQGPAFLTFANYRPIMRYNCSNYYALTVGQMADAIGVGRLPKTTLVGK
ncbi:lytic transglycosylase domain-containing protein [Sphingoaurantiacus capsulatus]|uniref:Lytic transglycosylase domain-containing protein n=1 Tax=Sphingoaurantiacus capsulatus TaxID=1771310 RepID=A0ABV7X6A6_9SPHN